MTYADAIKELENILEHFRSGTVEIDQLEAKTKRATELIGWCRARLRSVEGQLEDIAAAEDGELF